MLIQFLYLDTSFGRGWRSANLIACMQYVSYCGWPRPHTCVYAGTPPADNMYATEVGHGHTFMCTQAAPPADTDASSVNPEKGRRGHGGHNHLIMWAISMGIKVCRCTHLCLLHNKCHRTYHYENKSSIEHIPRALCIDV